MRFTSLLLLMMSFVLFLNAEKQKGKNKKDKQEDWNKIEYSGKRDPETLRMAMASKAFSWLSGSPADNEKLSIGKTAQFFGFVALRYQSGRAAQRGSLGRYFMQVANDKQKQLLLNAVLEEEAVMLKWWDCRNKILRLYEKHLYTGEAIDDAMMKPLAEAFGELNSRSARIEAEAFSKVEDGLSAEQWQILRAVRENPDLANQTTKGQKKPKSRDLSKELAAQYEDLFAKCFSWLTGNMEDNEVIPLGQPAQFFGFVSIRHKSGHGASRGQISKSFIDIMNDQQLKVLEEAVQQIEPWVNRFMEIRKKLLLEMHKLRESPEQFDLSLYEKYGQELGVVEIQCGVIEAQAYRKIRISFTEAQLQKMMELRSDYIIDEQQMEKLTQEQRGEKLYHLCSACHNKTLAPQLNGILGRKIASVDQYEYSSAMQNFKVNGVWNEALMNEFLSAPMKVVPGTKMAFQGLLNHDDRVAIIEYLKKLR